MRSNVDANFRETLNSLDPTGIIKDRIASKDTGIGGRSLVDMAEKKHGQWRFKPEYRDTIKSAVRQTAFDVKAAASLESSDDLIGEREIEGVGALMRSVLQRNAGDLVGALEQGSIPELEGALSGNLIKVGDEPDAIGKVLERKGPKSKTEFLLSLGRLSPQGYEYRAKPLTKANYLTYTKAFAELFTREIESRLGGVLAPIEQ